MRIQQRRESRVFKAIAAGIVVWLVSIIADVSLLPIDRTLILRYVIAASIGALVAIIVTLAIQLKHEEVHYQVAMERAAIVSELNHHVRNAIFPMHIAVQTLGDADAKKIADDAVERINVALRDATADALSGRIDYGPSNGTGEPQT